MAPQIHELLTLLSFFLSMILALIMVRKNLRKIINSIPNIPPGPWKLPIIGNIPHLVTSMPHRKLRDLAIKYGPLMHLQLGEIFTIVVSSAECAREVMKTHDVIFASRPHLLATDILLYDSTDIAFSCYGDYWRHLRKICATELLSLRRVKSLWSIREKEITTLIKWIASKEESEINITDAVLSILYTSFSKAAFGKKYEDKEEFLSAIKQIPKLAGGFYLADLFPSAKWLQNISGMRSKLEKMHQRLDRILENIVNDHRDARSRAKEALVEAKGDLIDVLLNFEDSGTDLDFHLTSNNIKAIIMDVFVAGTETIATAINWAIAEMMKHPRVLNKAQVEVRKVFYRRRKVDETGIDELKYLKLVIKEALRLHPPAPLLVPRECREACEINGYNIPVKSRILVNVWAIGRDPKYWAEPDTFYPERFIDSSIDYTGNSFEYIPFGAGRRICPGMNYGMANVEQILAFLLYHFDWRLPNGMKNEDLDLTEEFGGTMKRKCDLYLIPTITHPLPGI